jgi:3-oxoacid CoA-transferase subunit B
VKRIYTDMAVIDVTPDGFVLRETAPGCDIDSIRAKTGAALAVASDCRTMDIPEVAADGTRLVN